MEAHEWNHENNTFSIPDKDTSKIKLLRLETLSGMEEVTLGVELGEITCVARDGGQRHTVAKDTGYRVRQSQVHFLILPLTSYVRFAW